MESESCSVLSLYVEAYQEAQKHKWIESQKSNRDLGETAIRHWYRVHWSAFCKDKRLEHICGRQMWVEFEQSGFGGLNTLILDGDLLLDRILDRLYCGLENLEIINWAIEWNIPMDRVRELLRLIDINCARLAPEYC